MQQFGGGHANLTYLVAFGDQEYVLRRPPLGAGRPLVARHGPGAPRAGPPGRGVPAGPHQSGPVSRHVAHRRRVPRHGATPGVRDPRHAARSSPRRRRDGATTERDDRRHAGRPASGRSGRGRAGGPRAPRRLRRATALRLDRTLARRQGTGGAGGRGDQRPGSTTICRRPAPRPAAQRLQARQHPGRPRGPDGGDRGARLGHVHPWPPAHGPRLPPERLGRGRRRSTLAWHDGHAQRRDRVPRSPRGGRALRPSHRACRSTRSAGSMRSGCSSCW